MHCTWDENTEKGKTWQDRGESVTFKNPGAWGTGSVGKGFADSGTHVKKKKKTGIVM